MAGMVRFLPNNRLRAVLVITPQRDYLARAEEWVKKLDAQAEGTERQFYTYSVQNRRAQDLVTVLQSLLVPEGDGGRNVAPPYQEAKIESDTYQQAHQMLQRASDLTSKARSAAAGPGGGKQGAWLPGGLR
jgi:general secretion pathway protein D